MRDFRNGTDAQGIWADDGSNPVSLPDHPHLLQTFIWQDYDLAPKFPVMFKFMEFWKPKLEGPLHSVHYSHRRLIAPNEWRKVNGEFVLH